MAGNKRFCVGYALLQKKQDSFIRESLVSLAKSRGIDLINIDKARSLLEQGTFDCVLHKHYSDDWKRELKEFKGKNPNAVVLDSPKAIERLHNRISMLQVVFEVCRRHRRRSVSLSKS